MASAIGHIGEGAFPPHRGSPPEGTHGRQLVDVAAPKVRPRRLAVDRRLEGLDIRPEDVDPGPVVMLAALALVAAGQLLGAFAPILLDLAGILDLAMPECRLAARPCGGRVADRLVLVHGIIRS